ncbi:MAG TPA: glycosyltransferase family 2 protein, partial [Thermoanaerobaculia bacterium]|nr:glycosyltransferase family 2 protein [Thermoanaerobaculia bacterium]
RSGELAFGRRRNRLRGFVRMKIVALIPAYNAAQTVGDVVRECKKFLDVVVVVNDGSRDETASAATIAGAEVVAHAQNRGKGAALKTGFAWALEQGIDAVITLDADGQHLPREIPKFIDAFKETHADLIIGGRSHLFDQMLPRRRMANRFSAWSISKASGRKVTDSQSGFRLYSANLLRNVRLRTDGFDMESEVIVRAGRDGFKIKTIPIDLSFVDGIATSHYKPLKDTLRIAWTVTRARLFWR